MAVADQPKEAIAQIFALTKHENNKNGCKRALHQEFPERCRYKAKNGSSKRCPAGSEMTRTGLDPATKGPSGSSSCGSVSFLSPAGPLVSQLFMLISSNIWAHLIGDLRALAQLSQIIDFCLDVLCVAGQLIRPCRGLV